MSTRTYKKIRSIKKDDNLPNLFLCSIENGPQSPSFVTAGGADSQRSSVPTFKLRLMEQLNRIEIRGNVGAVRLQVVGNSRVAKISVATNYVYKGRDGEPVIETTCYSNR